MPLDLPSTAAPRAGRGVPRAGTLVARGLARRFGATEAVQPFELELGPDGVIGLLGPNGSGKSTFLRMLVGLVRPDAGAAWVDGVPLEGDGTAIRARTAYAPGETALYGELDGDGHLAWLLRGRGREARERAARTAEDLGLPLGARVRTYSHGMKRQLLFAAALAPDVRVRILDEPTEGLDPSKRGQVLDLLAQDARRGTTILLSSHHLGEVDRACDRLVFLGGGRVIADETARSVAARARRFLRLSYDEADDLRGIGRALSTIPRARVVRDGARFGVHLESEDARAFLGEACALPGLPPPARIEYGQLSLVELYRELYGVEGC
jgi:ABC-2 type transport system ATP-binding protein